MQPRSISQFGAEAISFEELMQMMLSTTTIARQASYQDLTENLNQFLLPHGINIKCCDIFEETLLKEAGITTQPTKCIFVPAGDHNERLMGFRFEGITYDDLLKFASYYNNYASDHSDVEMQFDKSTGAGSIIVEVNVVFNKLLPAFKAAFPNISHEKLDHYSDLSEKDDDVIDYNLLQSILILVNTTLQLTEDKLKAGMLTILNAQLKNVIDQYRKHQLHDCPEKPASTSALGKELTNFLIQSKNFAVLRNDANIESVLALIREYARFSLFKQLKKSFGADTIAAMQAAENDNASSASDVSDDENSTFTGSEAYYSASLSDASSEYSSSNSSSASEPASPRSDSPLRSVASLFATPPSTPSRSRSGSTLSLPSSDDSTELVSSFGSDYSLDIFADEPDFVPLSVRRFG